MARKRKTVDLDRENDIAPGLVAKTKKRLVVAGGRSHPALSADVAAAIGTELVPTEYRTFASGEILTRFEVSIRGCDFFLIQSFGPPVNEWLMETLIMLDAAKRASAKRITVVAPYYPYSRQDKKSRGREPISARLVADLLKTAVVGDRCRRARRRRSRRCRDPGRRRWHAGDAGLATDGAGFNPGLGLDAGGGGPVDATASMMEVGAPFGDVRTPGVDLGAPIAYGGDLSGSLILYLRLDDGPGTVVVKDGSGRGSIANLRSVDPVGGWSDGRFARAVALAGQSWNGWVEVASNAGLNALNTQMTFALWVWRDQLGGVLISRRAVGPRGFVYEIGFNGDALYARLNTAAAYTVRVTGPTVPKGKWVHVAMTFDVKQVQLRVDGKPVGAAAYLQSLPLENSALVVGGAEQQDGQLRQPVPWPHRRGGGVHPGAVVGRPRRPGGGHPAALTLTTGRRRS